ncbi:MAG: LacI family transcriptional regulator [Deltaproteobacteria bacterium]|jgi:tripartite-type tricarboxylate transporter receptor subunit TctC|nr:LacI family transcriptional regulator [Deltaproteobacteria bacterium]
MKRVMVSLAFALLCVLGFGSLASAASYPARNIEMVIPMLAGAAGDITGRILAEELSKEMGARVIVSNKPGGNFTLGTDMVARAKKDGYTIAYTNSPAIVYARALEPKAVPYNPEKDLDPLGLHVFFPQAIAVQAKAPWKTFKELVDYAKQNPGKLRCANPGHGSASTFVLELTQNLVGMKVTQVPTKGGQLVATTLMGGHVEMSVGAISMFASHVQNGELRLLLITKKLPEFPDVPTLNDLGYKADLPSGWFALYGPAGLPADVKKVLVPAIKKAVESPVMRPKLEKMFYLVDYRSPEHLAKMAKEEHEAMSAIAKQLGIQK